MTDQEYATHIGKLCCDKDNPNIKYMVYDMYYKLNHKGGMFLAYKFIRMDSGFLGEAHFFDDAAYVRWLTPNS